MQCVALVPRPATAGPPGTPVNLAVAREQRKFDDRQSESDDPMQGCMGPKFAAVLLGRTAHAIVNWRVALMPSDSTRICGNALSTPACGCGCPAGAVCDGLLPEGPRGAGSERPPKAAAGAPISRRALVQSSLLARLGARRSASPAQAAHAATPGAPGLS